jgi:hypothetical protein
MTSLLSLGDLQDDVAELKELAQRCLRPAVKAMLTAECERLELELTTRRHAYWGRTGLTVARQ